jgi:hypothetical protein
VRALFLLLLLANLLFAAWSLWVAPAPSAEGLATPGASGPGGIRLLRELPAPPAPAVDAGLAALDEAGLACVSAGPYLDRAEAERAAARLADLGYTARLREGRDEVSIGQWVRVEGLATPEDAANALAALQAAGLAEAYVVTDEQAGTVVSLGVYSDAARASESVAAARAAGFEPRIVDAMRTADVAWLDVDRLASGGLPTPEQLQPAETERLPRIALRPCPAPETAVTPGDGPPEEAAAAAPAAGTDPAALPPPAAPR